MSFAIVMASMAMLTPPASSDGHPRSADCTAIAMAERMCGTADRINPTGLPGPRRRVRRAAPASSAQSVPNILQRSPHALITGEGRAGPPRGAGRRSDVGYARLRRAASPIHTNSSFRQGHLASRTIGKRGARRRPYFLFHTCPMYGARVVEHGLLKQDLARMHRKTYARLRCRAEKLESSLSARLRQGPRLSVLGQLFFLIRT